jgi:hypothetical protein
MKVLIFLFLCLLSCWGLACDSVNLYEKSDNPLHKIPIYDQDGDGLCYAYTASQLIDYHNIKKNPDHKLSSAVWIAFAHKYKNLKILKKFFNNMTHPRRVFGVSQKEELGYSDINIALSDIRSVGICDIDILQKSISKFRTSDKITEDEFLYLFNLVFQELAEKLNKNPRLEEEEKKLIFEKALNKLILERKSDILDSEDEKKTVHNLNQLRVSPELYCDSTANPSAEALQLYKQVMSMFSYDKKNKQLDLLAESVFIDCFKEGAIKKVEIPKTQHIGEFYASNEKILNAIDNSLDEKKSPAALGYCAKLLSAPDQQSPVKMNSGLSPRVAKFVKKENIKNCSPHYSLVVGRRKKENTCQYMIRNSYGSHFWNETLDCLCEKDGKQFECNYKTHGDQDLKVLGCWINGQNLSDGTFSVTTFK